MTEYLITIALSALTWTTTVVVLATALSLFIEWIVSKWSGK